MNFFVVFVGLLLGFIGGAYCSWSDFAFCGIKVGVASGFWLFILDGAVIEYDKVFLIPGISEISSASMLVIEFIRFCP